MSSKSAQKPGKDNFTRNLVIAMVTLVVVVLLIKPINNVINPKVVSQAIPAAATVDNGYSISFNKELTGVPVLDIYEDFQCPVCKDFEGVNMQYIDSLISEKKATVHFHMMSFIGPESVDAANAAACSSDEGKFVEFHNTLYINQPAAENSKEWSSDRLIELGKGVGITSSNFEKCIKDLGYEGWVYKSAAAAEKAGVNGTPTVFVNGKKLETKEEIFTLTGFKAAVEG